METSINTKTALVIIAVSWTAIFLFAFASALQKPCYDTSTPSSVNVTLRWTAPPGYHMTGKEVFVGSIQGLGGRYETRSPLCKPICTEDVCECTLYVPSGTAMTYTLSSGD